jgi:hypothetical protein
MLCVIALQNVITQSVAVFSIVPLIEAILQVYIVE